MSASMAWYFRSRLSSWLVWSKSGASSIHLQDDLDSAHVPPDWQELCMSAPATRSRLGITRIAEPNVRFYEGRDQESASLDSGEHNEQHPRSSAIAWVEHTVAHIEASHEASDVQSTTRDTPSQSGDASLLRI